MIVAASIELGPVGTSEPNAAPPIEPGWRWVNVVRIRTRDEVSRRVFLPIEVH
jgi:hypothetical protein